jgi:anti-sigma factor RsiW
MHPTKGAWREFLDQEADDSTRQELELHLSTCSDCCSVTFELGRQRAAVAELLNALDATGPTRTSADVTARPRGVPGRSVLWAAGIALCLVTVASATVHLRVWQHAKDWLLGSRPAVDTPSVAPQPLSPASRSPTGISLEPRHRIEVRFDEWPSSGEIEVAVRVGTGFSIISTQPVQYSVRNGSVAVANSGVDASFRIVVPESLPEAFIQVAGRTVCVKHGLSLTGEVRRTGPSTYLISAPSPRPSSH